MIVAIDGPAASGKTTVAARLAAKLNYRMVDSGSMYRAVALAVVEAGVDLTDGEKITEISGQVAKEIRFEYSGDGDYRVILGDRDITEDVRSRRVNEAVSPVSRLAGVRSAMVDSQRRIAGGDAVVEGRDIGTVVFPDAQVKVYLDATLEERARRRYVEERQKGMKTTLETVKADISTRDEIDSKRELSPLARAGDAVLVDTDGLEVDEVVNRILALVISRS